MSIITQALKKAQYEQRQHHAPFPLQQSRLPTLMPMQRRWPWVLITAGCAAVIGAGLFFYAWRTPSLEALLARPLAMEMPGAPPMLTRLHPTAGADAPPVLLPVPQRRASTPVAPARDPHVETTPAAEPRPLAASLTEASVTPSHSLMPSQTALSVDRSAAPGATGPPGLASRNQSQAQIRFNTGLKAQQAGDTTQAEQQLLQAIALDPSFKEAYNNLGNLYYQREAYNQAKVMYQHALEIDPDYVKARNNLGNAYMQLAMYAAAIAELNKVISTDSESGLAHYNLACVYARSGDATLAARYLNQAIEREPQARVWARTDADFTSVRMVPAFQQILGAS
jgi:Tfp pilus assembly protein PilF